MDASNIHALLFGLFIVVEALIALYLNIIIFKIKAELRTHGYQVTWFYGTFFDLILLYRLYLKTRNQVYLNWLIKLEILLILFISLFVIMIR